MKTLQNTRRSQQKNNFMPSILAIFFCLQSAAVMAALIFVEIPKTNVEPLILCVGQVMALVNLAAGYWLGSTSGSKHKDQLIADSMPVQRGNDANNTAD